jgi:hypothetical protein
MFWGNKFVLARPKNANSEEQQKQHCNQRVTLCVSKNTGKYAVFLPSLLEAKMRGPHYEVFCDLLRQLGYMQPAPITDPLGWVPPGGCQLISVGDAVDRGLDSLSCIQLLRRLIGDGHGAMVLGNHEWRMRSLLRAQLGLESPPVNLPASRSVTWLQLLAIPETEKLDLLHFIESLPCWLSIDGGKALVVHARWESRFARMSGEELVSACAFGKPSNSTTEENHESPQGANELVGGGALINLTDNMTAVPPRARWTLKATRGPVVFWGHQIIVAGSVVQIGDTINVESGCFEGNALSAYVYPKGAVFQAANKQHWRVTIKALLKAQSALFPHTIASVKSLLVAEHLTSEDDYMAWLQLEAERRGVMTIPESVIAAHRGIYNAAA